MRRYLQNAFGFNPFQQFEAMGKQNMAMFENAMRMFNPFAAGQAGMTPPAGPANGSAEPPRPDTPPATAPAPGGDTSIEDLRRKLDELQAQLADLSRKS
jgi:polyhydroxyalkanoate synthesis regulator protein